METGRIPRSIWNRTARGAAWFAAIAMLVGATTAIVWDARYFRIDTPTARKVAITEGEISAKRAAVVVLLRDIGASIDVLRTMADGDGESAQQARIALEHLRAKLR